MKGLANDIKKNFLNFIKIYKELSFLIFRYIFFINIFWILIFIYNYINTGTFDVSNLLQGIIYSTIIGYILFIITIIFIWIFSFTSIRIKIFLKKPIMRKLPIVLLFVLITITALNYNHTFYDKESLVQILNVSWMIFGLNITVFTFSYAFITNRLEKEKNDKIKTESEEFFIKTNYNIGIHSRYATFTFIIVNAIILIMASTWVLLTTNGVISRSNFVLLVIGFMLSTNTLTLVLSDVSNEVKNKKNELIFEETLIEKETESVLDIWRKGKHLKTILQNFDTITGKSNNDEIKDFIEKLQANKDTLRFENEKKNMAFFSLSLKFIKSNAEGIDLYKKMMEYASNIGTESNEKLIEILRLQKEIRKNFKKTNKIIRKLNKFKFANEIISTPH